MICPHLTTFFQSILNIMIIVTTKNADNTYKARINGFDTTITRDEATQFILAGKLCRKVNQPYISLAQLDAYVTVA